MPYIGNSHTPGDHTSNFKVLDDISSHTATFDGSSSAVVSTSDETIRIANHRFVNGQRVTYNNGGGGNIGGISSGTAYYVIFHTTHTIKLAATLLDAISSSSINLSSLGTGSAHTLTVAFDGVNTKFKVTHGGTSPRISNATQLQVAINNVIQRPNNNATTLTDGFAVQNRNIVFKTAPTSNDVFWGSLVGEVHETFDISNNKVDSFTADGTSTSYTLTTIPPSKNDIDVTLDGVTQHISSFNVIGNVLTFTAAPANGIAIQVKHIGFTGASTSGVTGFYGRTGNVVLTSDDNITTGNITVGTGVTIETNGQASFTGIVTANGGIRIPNNTGQLDISTNSGGDAQINTLGVLNLATSSFRLRRANGSAYFMNADQGGRVYLYYNGSERFRTTDKGIQVGTGVTIETNGQATFVGVVTFGSGSTTIDNNVVNVGTALTLGHTQGLQFHTQNLHSAGFEVNQINASGIITAAQFSGDGSNLTGVSGFSTALSSDTTSLLNEVFKTSVFRNIGAGTSVTIQSDAGSGNVAFSRLKIINVGTGSTLHIGAGTTFIMNVLNVF